MCYLPRGQLRTRPTSYGHGGPYPMTRWLAGILGLGLLLTCIVVPVLLAARRHQDARNFHVVRAGVLYRGAQPTPAGLGRLVNDHGIRTVVSLRDGLAPLDRAEEEFCVRE